jgi:hypothetical protein
VNYAEYNQQLKDDYWSELLPFRARSQRYESFYRGGQYSRKEKKQLKSYGLIPIVINISKPFVAQRRAILTSSKPALKVVPLQEANKLVADAAQQFLIGKWNSDYVDIHLNRAMRDGLVTGVGYIFVDLANFLDNSTFDINISHLNWKYVLPDPNAERFDLADAENILVRKIVGIKRAQVLYGLTEEEILSGQFTDLRGNNITESTQQAEVLDRFSKYPVDRWSVTPLEGEHLRDLPTVFYTNDLKNKVAEENRQLREDMKKLKVEGRIQLKNLRELKIYRGISVGKYGVYEGVMNIRDYPIVPFINEMGTRFADSQGDIESIEGIQKAENKFYLLTMHNAMLTGNMRFMGPKNAVKDKTKFQRSASVPGAYLDYEPDGTLPNGGAPTIIQPGQLSSAFYTLSQDLIEKAKFITSVYSPTLGDPSGTPETFSTAASLQNLGTQTIKELARRWEVQIAKIGEVALQFIQNYTDEGELLEFVDMESGQVKSPMAEQDTEAGEQVNKPIVLNQLVTKEGVIHEIKNNTRLGKYAVKVLSQPNFGSDRLAKAAFLKDMLMNKAIPPTAAVIALLADLMEIPGGQKLIDEIQKDTGAQSQLAQLAKQMKDMQGKLKRLDSDNTKLMKELEIADFRNDLDKTHRDIKDKAKERIDSIIPEGDGQ